MDVLSNSWIINGAPQVFLMWWLYQWLWALTLCTAATHRAVFKDTFSVCFPHLHITPGLSDDGVFAQRWVQLLRAEPKVVRCSSSGGSEPLKLPAQSEPSLFLRQAVSAWRKACSFSEVRECKQAKTAPETSGRQIKLRDSKVNIDASFSSSRFSWMSELQCAESDTVSLYSQSWLNVCTWKSDS